MHHARLAAAAPPSPAAAEHPMKFASLSHFRSESYGARFQREVDRGLSRPISAPIVNETDLSTLPKLVRAYLLRVGVVGRPRVRNFHVRFRGSMRSARNAPWMPIHAEQYEF